ncbi:MAG: prop effector [Gammaproteobacteria bacterium]|uniref:ProQ/FINO family protein n=1 Tax=Rhodoferax sp. TaxID=50421 RepID=UPI00179A519B|nr:ProQ/FINO family protein [Rhodoferax sp.]MBU3900695.1 prop effector [Gammaproteobacteria bacterium]MBA3059672.1 prop effector [Rhodoferax sp.]MBU3998379.1 prop effector [Gammaproteobacteria bacterium]MBU4081353.1 prop effector [Gammaproteobacteria bacterium]MBU4112334.1 prop effector [Gammaproteobacteria bacterium]
MTSTTLDAAAQDATPTPATQPTAPNEQSSKPGRSPSVQPVLEKLFELYPQLFGAEFLPLKLGIFQELLALHPEQFQRDSLKLALGQHTRSTRYLQSVAAGKPRHDLQGAAVEPVAPEHIHFALLELFRRRQGRSQADLRPKLRAQLISAFEASGLPRQDYVARVQMKDEGANALLEQAFAELDQKLAKQEALRSAFNSSGKTPEEFADMYGMDPREVLWALHQAPSQPVPAAHHQADEPQSDLS